MEVVERMGLIALTGKYRGRDSDVYHPALLIYGYANGVYSSRCIQQVTFDPVAFRYIAADQRPLFTGLAKMDSASTKSAVKGFGRALNQIEAQKRLSMTYDQGREIAAHRQLMEDTGVRVLH